MSAASFHFIAAQNIDGYNKTLHEHRRLVVVALGEAVVAGGSSVGDRGAVWVTEAQYYGAKREKERVRDQRQFHRLSTLVHHPLRLEKCAILRLTTPLPV